MHEGIRKKLTTLPLCPGVYLMKDINNNIIYIGKSKLLKNRVSQYFQNSAAHSPKTQAMVSQIADFEYILTDTEAESLALECNLIKKHRPKYNILLKDDKQYPYIKITTNERFPQIFMTRRLKRDGNTYFGPYMTALNVKESIEEIRKLFKIRSCKKNIAESNNNLRPCLYHQIGQCSAPCCGKITKEDYNLLLKEAISVLNGNDKNIIEKLKTEMINASSNLEFEKAAIIRDKITKIKSLSEKQNISSTSDGNSDFIGIYQENNNHCVQIFNFRNGNIVKSEYFTFENEDAPKNLVLESFVKQYYFTAQDVPKEIYISDDIDEKQDIEEWLTQIKGHKISFIIPQRGKKFDIMKMVLKNAQESLYKDQMYKNRNESYQNRMLAQLKELLSLNKIPFRIEAYDISNFSGTASTGVMIVYKNAAPTKHLYRKYNIKTVEGSNDYESTREVIFRRINEAYKEEDLIKDGKLTPDKAKFLPLPDLILLDGGKGHVNAVQMVLDTLGEDIPLFGLVKDSKHKTKGIVNENNEFTLDKKSDLFKFLACMQDEVHRFAINATRKKHQKSGINSQLENIPGVGPKTRKILLAHFKSINKIKSASIDELSLVLNKNIAKNVYEYFRR